mmetsp:Transcript_8575/g.25299  ORF Transcript_8575/g.25299 Transcript_8575/m.25299 type:complete len:365 (-) Transcript_8575:154-1248(-)
MQQRRGPQAAHVGPAKGAVVPVVTQHPNGLAALLWRWDRPSIGRHSLRVDSEHLVHALVDALLVRKPQRSERDRHRIPLRAHEVHHWLIQPLVGVLILVRLGSAPDNTKEVASTAQRFQIQQVSERAGALEEQRVLPIAERDFMHEAHLVRIQLVEGENWPDGIRVGRGPLDVVRYEVSLRDHDDILGVDVHHRLAVLLVNVCYNGRGSIDAGPEQNGRHVVLLVEHERDVAKPDRPVSGLSVTARPRPRHCRHVLLQSVAERFGSPAALWRGRKEGEERVAGPYTRVDTDARPVAAIGLPVGCQLVGDRHLVAGPIAGPRAGSKRVHKEAQQEDGHPEHERKEHAEQALLRCHVQPCKRPTER